MIQRGVFSMTLLVFAALACSDGSVHWTGTVYDSAGVTVVANTDAGLWAPGDEWTLEEELRIGSVEGSPEYRFGDEIQISVDSQGKIYVLDRQASHVKVYTPEGTFLRTIGRQGEGPGELSRPFEILLGTGDTLLVPDLGNNRVNLFAPDGSDAGSSRLYIGQGRLLGFRGSKAGAVAEHIRFSEYFGSDETATPMDVILRLGMDGAVTDTFLVFPPGEMYYDRGITVYAPEPVWTLSDDSDPVFGVNDNYRIEFYSDRFLKRVIQKAFEKSRVSDREAEAVMGVMHRAWREVGMSPEGIREASGAWRFAEFYPAFRALEMGPGGTTWVQHVQKVTDLTEQELAILEVPVNLASPDWDVFDPEGRFLGVVSMPKDFELSVFRGRHIYGVWRDSLKVPYVIRLRIVGDIPEPKTL